MLRDIYTIEFNYIVKDILDNNEFKKTKDKKHHGITRYDHLYRVAFYTFIITKLLRLDYIEATRAALLHDFFIDETDNLSTFKALQKHPKYALENSKKYFYLTPLQEDIILTHMFPVTLTPPKYVESIIVDIVDDVAGIYEKYKSSYKEFKAATTFLFVLMINFINK